MRLTEAEQAEDLGLVMNGLIVKGICGVSGGRLGGIFCTSSDTTMFLSLGLEALIFKSHL